MGAWRSLLTMAGAVLTMGLLYSAIEKKTEKNTFGEFARHLFDGSYWANTTLVTVGYGDEAPKTVAGRTLAMFWQIVSLLFLGWVLNGLNGAVPQKVTTVNHLPSEEIVVLKDSTSEALLRLLSHENKPVETEKELWAAYHDGATILHDESLITATFPDADPVRLSDTIQYYGILLPEDSPYLELINQGVIKMITSAEWEQILSLHKE